MTPADEIADALEAQRIATCLLFFLKPATRTSAHVHGELIEELVALPQGSAPQCRVNSVAAVSWEYLEVRLGDERKAEDPPAVTDEYTNTRYASITRPNGKADRVDLWVWLEKADKHKAFHKNDIQLLCELGADGWELVGTHFMRTSVYRPGGAHGFNESHHPEDQVFLFKRLKT